MKKFLSALCATAMTASFALGGALPANAAPIHMPKAQAAEHSDVVNVQDWRWKRNRPSFGNERVNRNIRRGNRHWDNRRYVDRRGNWHNGHRGYRYKRHWDDRYYNGFWFPAGAFIAGAIVGGAIANSNNGGYYRGGGGSAHVEWCYDRYRSYRASDNTFQPYNGPRRQCYSPYS